MGKKLQLTFDDGPLDEHSLEVILNELATRKIGDKPITAAFFVLGQEVHQAPAAAKKILNKDHIIGNHSWDHLEPHTSDYSDAQIVESFRKCHEEIKSTLHQTMRYWRAPRGEALARVNGLLAGNGHLYTLTHCQWHADSKDSQGANSTEKMLTSIREDLANVNGQNARVLFHVVPSTATSLKAVLDALINQDGHSLADFSQVT